MVPVCWEDDHFCVIFPSSQLRTTYQSSIPWIRKKCALRVRLSSTHSCDNLTLSYVGLSDPFVRGSCERCSLIFLYAFFILISSFFLFLFIYFLFSICCFYLFFFLFYMYCIVHEPLYFLFLFCLFVILISGCLFFVEY
jgi:hypothetical protein